MSPRLFFRILSIAEAVTWTLLLGGMFAKYVLEIGELGVQVGGFLHGLVFIAYGMSAIIIAVNQRWSPPLFVLAVATAVIPFATIPFDIWADRTGRLDGPWRSEATDDPRDSTIANRVLRWLLKHPVGFSVLFVVVLAVVMATLLMVGPPGGE